jgi:hypothetical protein
MDESDELRLRLRLANARIRLKMIANGKWPPPRGEKWAITERDLEGDAENLSADIDPDGPSNPT